MVKAPKSPVEFLDRVEVNIGTGFKFKFGEKIRPGTDEVKYVIRTLFDRGYLADLLPAYLDANTLLSAPSETLGLHIPGILGKINTKFDQGIYSVPKDTIIVACAYVLSWHWFHKFGGPEPITPKHHKVVGPRKITPPIPELGCPFCFAKFKISPRYRLASVVYTMWVVWLIRHGNKAHHWDINWASKIKL